MIRFTLLALAAATLAAPVLAQPAITTADYRRQAEAELARLKAARPIERRAKNVIIFIGDGMGVSTLTAARIHQGQRGGVDGESFQTAMDGLAHSALVKTYGHDAQVVDSAPSATAILAGVKTGNGVIGLGPEARPGECTTGRDAELPSIMALAQRSGRATGIISTARITHATPAATYAHTADRDWEADSKLTPEAKASGCIDIARQLIEGPVGSRLNLVLGGGRQMFLPANIADPEYADQRGLRTDGRNLIEEWRGRTGGRFVWNARDFLALDAARDRRVLGLFEPDHMQYEADRARDRGGEPSLSELTRAAITNLSRNRKGFVLMVEAGRIDHAHHGGNARRALEDTIALDEAVRTALAAVDLRDTLVLVTSDHSHVFTMAGYPVRGNPILGVVAEAPGKPTLARDRKPYTTLGYANGPGAAPTATRPDPSAGDTGALDYKQQSLVPLGSETHGGDDVMVRASGAMAHLFRGTIEQHTIYHIMREAMTGSGRGR
jgi:alkaline phosphatase